MTRRDKEIAEILDGIYQGKQCVSFSKFAQAIGRDRSTLRKQILDPVKTPPATVDRSDPRVWRIWRPAARQWLQATYPQT